VSSKHFVPNGWKRLSLHQLALIQTGVAKGKKDIKNPVECPYLRVANVQDGHLALAEIKTISIASNEQSRYSLRCGDVLMTEGGDFDKLGRGFVWEEQIPGCLHQNHVFAVRPDSEKLDSYFLSYQAGSSYGKGYFVSCSKQSTNLASINSSQLKEYPVLLPSLQEQKAIVKVVQKWDCSIDLTERLVAAKQERRAWLMQQLLTGKRRLPGFVKSWRETCIGDFLKESRIPGSHGKSAKKITVKLYGLGVLPKADIREGSENTKYYTRKKGQFIYSKLDFLNGAFGIVPKELDGYESTLDLPCFDIRGQLEPKFLLNLVSRDAFYSRFLGSAMGGRKARRVNPSEFLAILIRLPDVEEQKAIVHAIDLADRELDLLRAQLDALREQKKGLMQQLLTGKVRVKV
jgi:type I restriction enzyme, S subunit